MMSEKIDNPLVLRSMRAAESRMQLQRIVIQRILGVLSRNLELGVGLTRTVVESTGRVDRGVEYDSGGDGCGKG